MSKKNRTEINRQNAAASTGPVTEEGKNRSKFNAVRHGLSSKSIVLPNESEEEYNELRKRMIAVHKPVGDHEHALTVIIAETFWRRQRFYRLQTAFLTSRMNALLESAPEGMDPDEALIQIFQNPTEMPGSRLMLRYTTAAEKAYTRAVAELEKIQAERRKNEETENDESADPEPDWDLLNQLLAATRGSATPGFVLPNKKTAPDPAENQPQITEEAA